MGSGKLHPDRVDGVMRAAVLKGLEGLFVGAAEELRAIDVEYEALAKALLESLRVLRLACSGNSRRRRIPPVVIGHSTVRQTGWTDDGYFWTANHKERP